VRHRLGLATRTQISVCKSPFPSARTAVSLFRAKTVQQRPLLPREVETWLPDCGVTHWVRIDHLSRLPVMPPGSIDFRCQLIANLATTASWMSVVAVVGLGYQGQLSCLMIFSTSLLVAAFLRRAGGSM